MKNLIKAFFEADEKNFISILDEMEEVTDKSERNLISNEINKILRVFW